MSRTAEAFFDDAYAGVPPWDIGRPQPEFVRLEEAGRLGGSVLDVGCGTGENALFLSSRGHEAWGVDASPRAIQKAQTKAKNRRLDARFQVADALELPALARRFDNVIDCGLFHVFSDPERALFERSLFGILGPGGRYFMLCFSDREPGDWGPRRVRQREIKGTFGRGRWRVQAVTEASFETNLGDRPVRAWLAHVERR